LAWSDAKAWLTQGAWVSVSQIANAFLISTDVLIIERTLGAAAAVPYACTFKLAQVLAHQPNLIMQAAGPALSELRASNARARLIEVCSALTQLTLLLSGAVAVGVLAVNDGFVRWWVGAERWGGNLLTGLLLAAMVLRHWNATATYSIFCFGYERRISLTTFADGAVTVLASAFLVDKLGLIGAPLGSLVGVLLIGNASELSSAGPGAGGLLAGFARTSAGVARAVPGSGGHSLRELRLSRAAGLRAARSRRHRGRRGLWVGDDSHRAPP
jgi:O-antigen/teichoic acid export membrane protein